MDDPEVSPEVPKRPNGGSPRGGIQHGHRLIQQEVIRYLLEGLSVYQIARIVGVETHTIYHWLKRPEMRAQIHELHSQLLAKLDTEIEEGLLTKAQLVDRLGFKALKAMEAMLDDPNTHVGIKAKVAQDVLDRDPTVSRTKKMDITEKRLNLTGNDLLHAVNSMREIEEREKLKRAEDSASQEVNGEFHE